MNKSDKKFLSRATDNLLVELQKNKEKLKKCQDENKQLKRKVQHKDEVVINQNKSYNKLEKMLISMLERYNRKCPCENPDECEELVCFSLQPDERVIGHVSSESESD